MVSIIPLFLQGRECSVAAQFSGERPQDWDTHINYSEVCRASDLGLTSARGKIEAPKT